MADELAGALAPAAPVADAPAANAVPASENPALGEAQKQEPVQPPKTFTEDEVRHTVNERLSKERKRLERIVRAEMERDHYKQQLETLQRPAQQPQQPGAPKADDPKYASNYEQYLIDKAKFELKQEQLAEARAREEQSKAQRQQSVQADLGKTLRQKIEAAAEKYPDIEDVAQGDVPYTEPMLHYFADSDLAGDLIYHLGKNPKEAARIADLSAAGQFRELAKLESKLSAPPKPTSAPSPIKPASGNSGGEKDPDKMTTDEWREWREAQLRSKRR